MVAFYAVWHRSATGLAQHLRRPTSYGTLWGESYYVGAGFTIGHTGAELCVKLL